MKYGEAIAYNSPNITYNGALAIYASSLSSPIILNNITIFYSFSIEDYSNYTTIGILSLDTSPDGVISITVLDEDVAAIASAEVIYINADAEISIITSSISLYSSNAYTANNAGAEVSIIP